MDQNPTKKDQNPSDLTQNWTNLIKNGSKSIKFQHRPCIRIQFCCQIWYLTDFDIKICCQISNQTAQFGFTALIAKP